MENARAPHPTATVASNGPRRDSVLWLLRALFSWYFDRKLTRLLGELQSLFEAWKSGTLPPAPEPCARNTQAAPVSRPSRVRQRHFSVRRPRAAARIAMRAIGPASVTTWPPTAPRFHPESLVLVVPNSKNPILVAGKSTPILLRFQN